MSPRSGPSRPRLAPHRAGLAPHRARPALNLPRTIEVRADLMGVPREVGGREIDAVRESWLVEDRWWTAQPLCRRYWELVGCNGENIVVFHDLRAGGWFTQKA